MNIYNFEVKDTKGELRSLKDYEGKVVLIVNTASKCGLTPQFEGLQSLYTKYAEQGFVILGFPCSQFKEQEFDNIDETMQFCQLNFGVSFPMFAKIDVNGEQADPLFNYLKDQVSNWETHEIEWNFSKFLVDRAGQVVQRFAPTTTPEQLEQDIENLL